MQIDSGHSGYNYHGRIREVEKIAPTPAKAEDQQTKRGPGTPTVSSAALAGSLASILWSVNADQAPVDPEATAPLTHSEKVEAKIQWVQSAYFEND